MSIKRDRNKIVSLLNDNSFDIIQFDRPIDKTGKVYVSKKHANKKAIVIVLPNPGEEE